MVTRSHMFWLFVPLVAACDMDPAEILDAPRVLAIRMTPAELAPGEPHDLEALTFQIGAELEWSLCPEAWSPTDPLSCPSGDPIALGRGNALNVTMPSDLDSAWLRVAPVDTSALPATRRVAADSGATNPVVLGLRTPTGDLPPSIAPGASIDLIPSFGPDTDTTTLVASWYVTAGTLEPARTLGDEPATLTLDSRLGATPAPIDVIVVVRTKLGGTAWTSARLEVAP